MKTLTADEFVSYIKENGITLAKTTVDYYRMPKGAKVWFGIDRQGLAASHDSWTDSKNKEFNYDFDYGWHIENDYNGKFELITKNINVNKLTSAIKRRLNKGYHTLYEVGYIDGNLEMTDDGKRELVDILLEVNLDALTSSAQDLLDEQKKDK